MGLPEMRDSAPISEATLTLNEYALTPSAREAIRFKFNPSGLDRVGKIKLLTGALLTELDAMESEADDQPPGDDVPPVYAHINRARDAVIVASMCTELAATTGK